MCTGFNPGTKIVHTLYDNAISRLVMGLGQKFSTLIGSDQPSLVWIRIQKFILNIQNFSIFPLQIKNNLFGSGQKVPVSKMRRPLLIAGQNYAQFLAFLMILVTNGQRLSAMESNAVHMPSDLFSSCEAKQFIHNTLYF